MAKEEIVITTTVAGVEKSIESLKDLKGAIKAAKDEQIAMSQKFGATSNEAVNATKKLSSLKDKVEDLNDSTQSLKGSGVEKLTSSFRLLGEGIGSFDMEKIKTGFKGLGSAMGAIPIFLVIEGLKLLYDNFDKVLSVVRKIIPSLLEQSNITKELNTASIEGAKNAAVERNNLDNLYKASTDQTKSIGERKDAQIELQETYPLTFKNFTEEDFALGKAKIGYDNLSKSILDASLLKAKQGLLDKGAMEFAEGEQERLNEIAAARVKLTKASRESNVEYDNESKRTQTLASDYEVQKSAIDKLISANTKETESFQNKNAIILGDLSKYQKGSEKLDAEHAAAKLAAEKAATVVTATVTNTVSTAARDKRIEDEKKLLSDIERAKQESYIKTFESEQAQAIVKAQFENDALIKSINATSATKATKNKALEQAEINLQENYIKIRKDYTDKQTKLDEIAAAAKIVQDEKDRVAAETNQKNKVAGYLSNLESSYQLDQAIAGDNDSLKLENEKTHLEQIYQINIASAQLIGASTFDLDKKYSKDKLDLEKRTAAQSKKIKLDEIKKSFDTAKAGLDAAQGLSDIYFTIKSSKVKKGSIEEEQLARKQFNIQKAFNLAKVTMDGVMAVTNIVATTPKVDFGISTGILIAGSIITTAASLAKIAAAQFDSGASAPSADTSSSTALPTTAAAPQIYGQGQGQSTTFNGNQNNNYAPIKAYVVETDNRNATRRINKLVSESTY